MRDKHLCCIVMRLFSNELRVEGGWEVPRLAQQPSHLTVEIGSTRYCVHFSTVKGGFPDWLRDPALMTRAQELARELVTQKYGISTADVEALFKPPKPRDEEYAPPEKAEAFVKS